MKVKSTVYHHNDMDIEVLKVISGHKCMFVTRVLEPVCDAVIVHTVNTTAPINVDDTNSMTDCAMCAVMCGVVFIDNLD